MIKHIFTMEKRDQIQIERKNGLTTSLRETIISVLDLSYKNITNFDNIEFPANLVELNLSNNRLKCIPPAVLHLKCLKLLNFSSNHIMYFDDTPAFCHTIEKLILSYNDLYRPPRWVWCEAPKNLIELDISCNRNITMSMDITYSEILQHEASINVLKMHNCGVSIHYELLKTLTKVKVLDFSTDSITSSNIFHTVPCKGLEKCCDVQRLNLSCTKLSEVSSNIDIYKNLIEINLADNNICGLPNEFCNLYNLEICILSLNNILYLPDNIISLKKLNTLCIDGNKLCMLPENMCNLTNLIRLDVYDNYLYDPPKGLDRLQELDLAQNYFDEPDDEEYNTKKKKLRSKCKERYDGRKLEIEVPDSLHSSTRSIDLIYSDHEDTNEEINDTNRILSSPEDWDSDDYWVPHLPRLTSPQQSPWLFFVKRKMEDGNFCPIDAHPISVMEKVRYEKICNPFILQECDGQFDDYSGDDS